MVAVSTQNIDVFAQTNDENLDTDSFEWTILLGDDLKNNPTAIKILKNIEISKQRLAELEQTKIAKTEHQKFIDAQRKFAQEKLQVELDRMFKQNKDFTPRAAYAKYLVNKVPEKLHEMHWELFDYLQQKIKNAEYYRDELIKNGGSFYQSRDVYLELLAMPKAERVWVVNQLNEKYGGRLLRSQSTARCPC